jgi:hypothetical protein
MKRIKCQQGERIFNDVAYAPKLAGYPTLSDINELCAIQKIFFSERRRNDKFLNKKKYLSYNYI